MAHGGKREGAGRKKGVRSVPALRDSVSEKERKAFIAHMLKSYPESDRIATWLGDHLYGKAPQTIDLEADVEETLTINDKQFKQIVRAAAARTDNDSGGS